MSNPLIEYLSFRPVRRDPKNSLIGFCGFRYNKEMTFSDLPVHKLLKSKGIIRIRILYPKNVVPNGSGFQQSVDHELNSYICAQYPESVK